MRVCATFTVATVDASIVQKICINLNYPLDDSYTPSALAIRAGTGLNDLQDVRMVTLDKPNGWITFDVSSEPNEEGDGLCVTSLSFCVPLNNPGDNGQ